MRALAALLARVGPSDSTVLIQGENGTGKELVARALHAASPRAARPFVVINCSALSDALLDSELFGHVRGAFTGAVADKPGLFEVADGGTFFLDEIGDMTQALQVKLLRVLQEGQFLRMGDTAPRTVDVRVIAATHRDLRAMVARGEFREDLYYRVHVIGVVVPPLRERPGDVAVLIDHFLQKHQRPGEPPRRLSDGAQARLLAHAWPGNVRELENEIERLVVLAGAEPVIDVELLSPRIGAAPEVPRDPYALPAAVEALERQMIGDALRRHAGNKTRAASELRISRRNLIRLCQKYQLA
jgi:two-component system response regulator HupR/HoxA